MQQEAGPQLLFKYPVSRPLHLLIMLMYPELQPLHLLIGLMYPEPQPLHLLIMLLSHKPQPRCLFHASVGIIVIILGIQVRLLLSLNY
jgi:hypothetical protein